MENTVNTNTVNPEINSQAPQTPKKRGRPAKTTAKRSKKFNLIMFEETFSAVNKLAAKEQFISGKRTSANEIINNIVEDHIRKMKKEEKINDVHSL